MQFRRLLIFISPLLVAAGLVFMSQRLFFSTHVEQTEVKGYVSGGIVTTFANTNGNINKVIAQEPEALPDPSATPTPVLTAEVSPTSVAIAKSESKIIAPKTAVLANTGAACTGSFSDQFLCLLNQYRVSQGKGKLSYNSELNKVSLTHSTWMNTTSTFSHTGAGGSKFTDRCNAYGITCYAENLASRASSAQNLLDMWKKSARHNTSLLGPYTTIGIGISGAYTTSLFK